MATNSAINTSKPIAVSSGGTGLATLTAHAIQVGNGTSALTQVSGGSNGQVLLGSTGADPAMATLTSSGGSIIFTTGANSLNMDVANWANTTFTPNLAFGGSSTGITYSTQSASYVRVGGMIAFNVALVLTSKGSATGAATIGTFPAATIVSTSATVVFNNVTYANTAAAFFGSSATTLQLENMVSGTTVTALTNTAFADNSEIYVSGIYFVT